MRLDVTHETFHTFWMSLLPSCHPVSPRDLGVTNEATAVKVKLDIFFTFQWRYYHVSRSLKLNSHSRWATMDSILKAVGWTATSGFSAIFYNNYIYQNLIFFQVSRSNHWVKGRCGGAYGISWTFFQVSIRAKVEIFPNSFLLKNLKFDAI